MTSTTSTTPNGVTFHRVRTFDGARVAYFGEHVGYVARRVGHLPLSGAARQAWVIATEGGDAAGAADAYGTRGEAARALLVAAGLVAA
jgi:hypothetical protein